MLVLSRKEGERIQIADAITLTVLSVHGGRVRLGFVAPADVPIHREELFRRISAEAFVSNSDGVMEPQPAVGNV